MAAPAGSRFPTVSRWRRGYEPADVDAFCERLEQDLTDRRAGRGGQLTTDDVRGVQFESVHGGYEMEDVDSYLDRAEAEIAGKIPGKIPGKMVPGGEGSPANSRANSGPNSGPNPAPATGPVGLAMAPPEQQPHQQSHQQSQSSQRPPQEPAAEQPPEPPGGSTAALTAVPNAGEPAPADWSAALRERGELLALLREPAGQRFARCARLSRGYRVEDVDRFVDTVGASIRTIQPEAVRNVQFGDARGGYDEDTVDAWLDRVEAHVIASSSF